MTYPTVSLAMQIKKEIGSKVLWCFIIFMVIVIGLTMYDSVASLYQLQSRVNEKIKPVENFVIEQVMQNDFSIAEIKIDVFNDTNPMFKIKWIRLGNPVFTSVHWLPPFSWSYDYHIPKMAGYEFGYFNITGSFLSDTTIVYEIVFRMILLIVFTMTALMMLYPLAKKIPEKLFINPINRFLDLVSNTSIPSQESLQNSPAELQVLETRILELLNTAAEHERDKAAIELGLLIAALAHDIRSPLGTMEVAIHNLSQTQSQDDLLPLSSGVQSLRDIVNNVLGRHRSSHADLSISTLATKDDGNQERYVLLFSLVDSVISEKRYEWQHNPRCIKFMASPVQKAGWVKLAPNQLKRVLSNLMNNAYESMLYQPDGIITIFIDDTQPELQLHIKDQGVGIPPEKIDKCLKGTSSKHSGKGLGLSGAKDFLSSLGGDLQIRSGVQKGTEVILVFPVTPAPAWFPEQISLQNKTSVVVLDDDASTLMLWQNRFSALEIRPVVFAKYAEVLEWCQDNPQAMASTLFLADYELNDKDYTGLSLLQSLPPTNKGYLITSHAEEAYFQNQAEQLGAWLIPKALVGSMKITK